MEWFIDCQGGEAKTREAFFGKIILRKQKLLGYGQGEGISFLSEPYPSRKEHFSCVRRDAVQSNKNHSNRVDPPKPIYPFSVVNAGYLVV